MIKYYIANPECSYQWSGKVAVDTDQPLTYTHFPPDKAPRANRFTTSLELMIASGYWVEIDLDLEVDEGL